MDGEGSGRLSVHGGLLDVAWFRVCKLGCSSAWEMNVSWMMIVGFVWKSSDSRVTCMHYIESIRMFEDGVSSLEHAALVMQGGSLLGGSGRWSNVCNLKNCLASWGRLSI